MPVTFKNIPSNIRVPLFYAEIDNSQASFFQQQSTVLLIGQMLSSGSLPTGDKDSPILITQVDQAKTLFGVGSVLARMVEVFKANNLFTEVWCMALTDNGSGVAADGEIAISGTATAAGVLNVYIAGQRVQVPVAVGDTATEVGDALEAAITALSSLPVTAANTTGTVAITAKHVGEIGNDIDLRVNYQGSLGGEITPAGLSVSITAMSSGAANPVLDNGIAAMGDKEFDTIVMPYTDSTSLNAMRDEMDDTTGRWSWSRQIYGHVFTAKNDTVGNLTTLGNSRNDQHMTIVGFHNSPSPAYEWVSAWAAQVALALANDPARPVQTLPLISILSPPLSSIFTISEQQTLLFDGIATWSVQAGSRVLISRSITTYQKNEFNEPDPSYVDVETLATLARVVRTLRQAITQKFARHKLADDGTRFGEGQAIVTPNIIRSELIAQYSLMEFQGLVENTQAFSEALIVERNATDPNRVDVLFPPDLVNQLRIFALLGQFRLQYSNQGLTSAT